MPPETEPPNIVGLLLAGGQSRRMGGGDKCMTLLQGVPMLARIIDRVRPQVGRLLINANGDAERFASFGLPVANDVVEGFAGPLAGVLTGLEWAAENTPQCEWVASFACDAPFVPTDLVAQLVAAVVLSGADLGCAASNGRDQPVFGLWPVRLAPVLRLALVLEQVRKVDVWTARYHLARADYGNDETDPFFNVNAPEDLATAEALMATESSR